MDSFDYWKECISTAADECGLVMTADQLNEISSAVEGAHAADEIDRLRAEVAAKDARIAKLEAALLDMLSGWKYIRSFHGDLYGVGWDRAQTKAEEALR